MTPRLPRPSTRPTGSLRTGSGFDLRAGLAIVLAMLALSAAAQWTRAAAIVPSREALLASFSSDVARVVYRWDPADPRSDATRQRALFDFVYQTYDSSAWIPQSLFDSNLVTQVVVGDVHTIVQDKVGLVPWRDNDLVPAFGMAPNIGTGQPLSWTVNCLVCHTAEIDGVAYLGAGTKTFDDKWLGESLKTLTGPAGTRQTAVEIK